MSKDTKYDKGYFDALDDVENLLKKHRVERDHDTVEPVTAKPCVQNLDMKTMKKLFLKLGEEMDEFKMELASHMDTLEDSPADVAIVLNGCTEHEAFRIAEEGADVCTMIATILHAVGIDDKTRFDAQAYVNKHNHERGRW